MKVYEALARAFVAEQVDTVFSLMGDGNLFWITELGPLDVKNYNARHEAAAVAMADRYARRASGKVGVCTVTRGPGLTQTATSLVAAGRYRVPMVMFLGASPYDDRVNVQYLDQRRFVEACEAPFFPIASAATALRETRDAFRIAIERRVPVVLDVPVDIQEQDLPGEYDYEPVTPDYRGVEFVPDADEIDRAAGLLASARRPIFVVGHGPIASDARAAIGKLANQVGALLATTLLAKGWLEDAPFQLGVSGDFSDERAGRYFSETDCVVAIGAGLNDYTTSRGGLMQNARVIQIADEPTAPGMRSQRVDCFLQGDARKTLELISDMFTTAGHESEGYRTDAVAADLATEQDPMSVGSGQARDDGLDPRLVAATLDRLLPDDCVVVQGAGHFWTFPISLIAARKRRFVYSNGFGSIGQALPVGVGVAVGAPDRKIVVVEGDTSVFMHLQEIDTAARYGLPVMVVVMDDDAMGAEFHKLNQRGMANDESIVPNPDFGRVAEALGGSGSLVRTFDELEPAINAAVKDSSGPHVVGVKISRGVLSMGGMGAAPPK